MTTVAQMIEWMKTLPQDAEVECGVEETGSYSNYMVMRPVDIGCCNVFDFTKDSEGHYAGKVVVEICGD